MINPVILQAKFARPIRTPENFGTNSTKLVAGPVVVRFVKVIAMVTMTIAEVAVEAYAIAAMNMALIPAPGCEKVAKCI